MTAPSIRTTNASWTDAGYVTLENDSVTRVIAHVYASDHNGDVARWEIDGTYKRVGSGNAVLIGALSDAIILTHKTTGALFWDFRLTVDGPNVEFEIKGGSGITVDWLVFYNDPPDAMVGSL